MKRKLIIVLIVSMLCSNAIFADGPRIKTYGDVFSEILKFNRKQAVVAGTIFGLGALGFGALTKYCWNKTKASCNRVSRTNVIQPNGDRIIEVTGYTAPVPLACWFSLSCFSATQVVFWGLPSLVCFLRANRLTPAKH